MDNGEKKRLHLSFTLSSPLQRQAWELLSAIPKRQKTDAVCRAVCQIQEQDSLLEQIRMVIREELSGLSVSPAKETPAHARAGDVGDDVLGFLSALQDDGGE